jgi:serine/threonine protein kinase
MNSVTMNLSKRSWQLGPQLGSADPSGFGHIHTGTAEDGSTAVIKLIPKVPGASRELLFEKLSGTPHVIPVLDTGEWQDNYVLVMPLAEKSLLKQLNDAGGRLALDEALPILVDVAETLASLEKDVVHRDLKPANVLLYQGHWCLADFGIARYAAATTAPDTRKHSMTPPYAAPEQWRAEHATSATDVYAFGVMMFQMLQGHLPFPGPDTPHWRDQLCWLPCRSLLKTVEIAAFVRSVRSDLRTRIP